MDLFIDAQPIVVNIVDNSVNNAEQSSKFDKILRIYTNEIPLSLCFASVF